MRALESFGPIDFSLPQPPRTPSGAAWRLLGARNGEPNLGKLAQHQLSNVVGPMNNSVEADRTALRNFINRCG